MLQTCPEERLGNDLCKGLFNSSIIKHKFFEGINFSKLLMKKLESPIKRSSYNINEFYCANNSLCKDTEFFTQSIEQENDPFYKWEFDY